MAYAAMKPTKAGLEEPQEQIHKIRITLSSKNVKNLEKGSYFFYLKFYNFIVIWRN
ncbi:putative ribosomal protein S10 [Helianthus debilis subsp. tardiflorus]